ncbi:MAG TPA: M56 family metallopeptidase [Vicinamibacterales bacterium]|jgi:beta-lactamase regulating signal transducer with metallopeptidase domain
MSARFFADVAAAFSSSAELSLAVKATIVLAAGLAISAAAARARSSVRHLAMASTLGALLALPVASALAPSLAIVVPVSTTVERAPAIASASGAAASPAAARDGGGVDVQAPRGMAMPSIEAVVRIVWGAGTVLAIAALAVSMRRLGRLRRTAVPWIDAPSAMMSPLTDAAGARSIDVLVHEDVAAPLTCGFVRPAIIFPPDARDWSAAEIRRAVLHEVEHVKRADWIVQILGRIACAIYWFHPLAWKALRTLRLEAERTCDDAVLRVNGGAEDQTEYAEQLVSLARRLKDASTPAVLAMASRSDLSARVASLLDARQHRGPAGAAATIATAVMAIATVAAIGPLRAVGAAPASPGEEQTTWSLKTAKPRTARGDRALYRASERGDVRRMAELIAEGADVNAKIDGDGSPLIGAARAGRLDAVRLLIERGADVNLGVDGDGSPLIAAAAKGHLPVVELLIARGALVDQVVDGDENALIQASAAGELEVVRFLVAKGADVNFRVWVEESRDQRGEWRTPLGMAVRARRDVVTAFLKSSGARE